MSIEPEIKEILAELNSKEHSRLVNWSLETPAINQHGNICFCRACRGNWENWIAQGYKLADRKSYSKYVDTVISERLMEAKRCSIPEYRETGEYLESRLKELRAA